MSSHPARHLTGPVLVLVLALTVLTGCTGHDAPAASPSRPDQSTSDGATLRTKPVPFQVSVRKVFGRMSKHDRRRLESVVRRPLSAYTDAAFLAGRYPRHRFPDAFSAFTHRARAQATHDRSLLTNADLGPHTVSVTAKRRRAALDVLAPNKVAAGVTARLHLRFLATKRDGSVDRVEVSGRLLLTRDPHGGWNIFGYHLARSSTTVQRSGRSPSPATPSQATTQSSEEQS